MSEPVRKTVECQDPDDGSGDFMIDLRSDALESMNLKIGDSLNVELVNGAIALTPVRDTGPKF
jgi:hypothetical protein